MGAKELKYNKYSARDYYLHGFAEGSAKQGNSESYIVCLALVGKNDFCRIL